MSDAVPKIYMICNSAISLLLCFSVIVDFVFCPDWITLASNEAMLFVVERNNKPSLSAVYSDMFAVKKAKII